MRLHSLMAAVLLVSACAGRSPQPVATVQPTDQTMPCDAMQAEIGANRQRIAELDREDDNTTAGNIALAVVGVAIFPPLLFAMNTKGAAGTEMRALRQRVTYLDTLVINRCLNDVDRHARRSLQGS